MQDQQESIILRERTELLNRIGVQLTVIAEGGDARLNNILKHLRESLRSGSELHKLNQTADVLFKYLMLDEQQAVSPPIGLTLSQSIRELAYSVQLPVKAKNELRGVLKVLEASDDLAGVLVSLKQVTTVVRSHRDGTHQTEQTASFKRLFGKKNRSTPAEAQRIEKFVAGFKGLLAELLDHMDVMHDNQAWVAELKEELWCANEVEQFEGIIQQVLSMLSALTNDVRVEQAKTEKYLNQLREKLQTVEEDITESVGLEGGALERAEVFGAEVSAEIGSIEEAVLTDNDLQHLKASVGGHIKIINKQLIDHIQHERELHQASKSKVKALTRKVREMENEADELRMQVHRKRQQALKDALTGVYNRAAYEERIREEISRFKRSGKPMALVVIDCDNFKRVNDNFGHKAGDLVLKKVAEVMKSRARTSDFLARYGGDEFVVLLPDTGEDGAKIFAESVRKRVATAGFNDAGKPLKITISSGLTVIREADSAESAFERADKAMYLAKNSGRNDVGFL